VRLDFVFEVAPKARKRQSDEIISSEKLAGVSACLNDRKRRFLEL